MYSGAVFVLLEFLMSLYTHSQAVLLDAIYDGVESAMIFISISIIPLLYRPANEKHPYGYLQVESLFVVIKGFMMVAVTVGLVLNNVEIALHGGRRIAFGSIAFFELFATIFSFLVILLLRRYDKKLSSPLLAMEIQGWSIDVVASFGMCVAFFLPSLVRSGWFLKVVPYLDQIIAIILSLFILPVPIRSIITGIRDLFLLAPEEETVDTIRGIIDPILYEYGYTNLYYDIVRTGRKLWISAYITFDKDMVSINRLKIVQSLVINALKKEFTDFYFELLPDIIYENLPAEHQ